MCHWLCQCGVLYGQRHWQSQWHTTAAEDTIPQFHAAPKSAVFHVKHIYGDSAERAESMFHVKRANGRGVVAAVVRNAYSKPLLAQPNTESRRGCRELSM